MTAADVAVIVYRLRKVAARTPEGDSDHELFVDAADTLESAALAILEAVRVNAAPHENTKQSNSRMSAVESALAGWAIAGVDY